MEKRISHELPSDFFQKNLTRALQQDQVSIEPYTEYYVVQLLTTEVVGSHSHDETLGEVFAHALRARPGERIRLLRRVGDCALVVGGLWWERSFRPRRPPHIEYYTQLGSMAYRTIGGAPFDEMASKFQSIASALARMSTDTRLVTSNDLFRLYILWSQTHHEFAARALAQRGLIPPQGA